MEEYATLWFMKAREMVELVLGNLDQYVEIKDYKPTWKDESIHLLVTKMMEKLDETEGTDYLMQYAWRLLELGRK